MLDRGQNGLIERMQAILPDISNEGKCFGVALMGMQAILAEDMDIFTRRMKVINEIPLNIFQRVISENTEKRLEIIKRVKIKAQKFSENTPKRWLKDFEIKTKLIDLNNTLDALISENKIIEKNREDELSRRSNQILYSIYIQQQVDPQIIQLTSFCSLPSDLLLDIPIFIQCVAIYQKGYQYSHLFDTKPMTQRAGINAALSLLQPKKVELKGGIKKLDPPFTFTGMYSIEDLIKFFASLKSMIERYEFNSPFAIILQSTNHAITIGNHPKSGWILIDANKCVRLQLTSPMLSKEIASSFFAASFLTFSTEFYVCKLQEKYLEKVLDQWKSTFDWKRLHESTPEKIRPIEDGNNSSWLLLACIMVDTATVAKLLKSGANADEKDSKGFTALHYAVISGSTALVEILLRAGARVDAKENDGFTSLHFSVINRLPNIVKVLLDAGANASEKMIRVIRHCIIPQ